MSDSADTSNSSTEAVSAPVESPNASTPKGGGGNSHTRTILAAVGGAAAVGVVAIAALGGYAVGVMHGDRDGWGANTRQHHDRGVEPGAWPLQGLPDLQRPGGGPMMNGDDRGGPMNMDDMMKMLEQHFGNQGMPTQ